VRDVAPVVNARRIWRDRVSPVVGPLVLAVRYRQWRRLWLSAAAAGLVVTLAVAFRTRGGHALLLRYAITVPADGWLRTLVKLPLSMFAPAALLPFWFAVGQVLLVYGFAQSHAGARRTLAVAVAAHTLATGSAHLWLLIGRPWGVPYRYAQVGDAGPSVAVVALLAYILTRSRAGWMAALMVAYHAAELIVFNGLAQREHLVGSLTGVAAAVATMHRHRPRHLRWRYPRRAATMSPDPRPVTRHPGRVDRRSTQPTTSAVPEPPLPML